MNARSLSQSALAGLLVLMSGMAASDDTDIYVDPTTTVLEDDVNSWPLVMLTLDTRPNVIGSSFCSADSDGVTLDPLTATSGCDALIDEYLNCDVVECKAGNVQITLLQALQAVLRLVFEELSEDTGAPLMRLGLMLPHDDGSCAERSGSVCLKPSNGGFISMAFGPTQSQVDSLSEALDEDYVTTAYSSKTKKAVAAQILRKMHLNALSRKILNVNQLVLDGVVAHPYQGPEMYLEYMRYLRGDSVFRGRQGWSDYYANERPDPTWSGPANKNPGLVENVDQDPRLIYDFVDPSFTNGVSKYYMAVVPAFVDNDYYTASQISTANGTMDGRTHVAGDRLAKAAFKNPDFTDPDEYTSPLSNLICTKAYAVNFMFGSVAMAGVSDKEWITNIQADTDNEVLGGTYDQKDEFEHVLAYANAKDIYNDDPSDGVQNIRSYMIVDQGGGDAVAKQDDYATAGGTTVAYKFSSSCKVGDPGYPNCNKVEALKKALGDMFRSIISVSTTFVAPSLPANAFNKTQTINELFMALFKAKEEPFWPGNLKKLKLFNDGSRIYPVDQFGKDAIKAEDGRILENALTFWTQLPVGTPDSDDLLDAADGHDGRAISLGGTGQQLQFYLLPPARKLFSQGITGAHIDFVDEQFIDEQWDVLRKNGRAGWDVDTPTPILNEVADLLEWAQGTDRWVMGDPLHSRPVAINYGDRKAGERPNDWLAPSGDYRREGVDGAGITLEANPDIRIVLGSNDGFMHMIRNTVPTTEPSVVNAQSGREDWAFMPREIMHKLARVRGLSGDPVGPPSHPVTVDGPPVVYRLDNNDDGRITKYVRDTDGNPDTSKETFDKVWLYFGLRRGGKHYYGIDITDPDAPEVKWKISGGSGGDPGFESLAQTWSMPSVGDVELLAGTDVNGDGITNNDDRVIKTVLVFGGGYNGDDDGLIGRPGICTDSAYQKEGYFDPDTFLADDTDEYDDSQEIIELDNVKKLGDDMPNRGCRVKIGAGHDEYFDDNEGNAVFMVDAFTGDLIWKLEKGIPSESGVQILNHPELKDSVPAQVAFVDMDGNGLNDRLYFGDTGGTLWRVNLADTRSECIAPATDATAVCVDADPAGWQAFQLLSIGRHEVGIDRRFMNVPDVISSKDVSTDYTLSSGTWDNTATFGSYDGIAIGTGDREDPTDDEIENAFYFYRDAYSNNNGVPYLRNEGPPDPENPPTEPTLPATDSDLAGLSLETMNPVEWKATTNENKIINGWRFALPHGGEKNLAEALTIGGVIYFTTYEPKPKTNAENPCAPTEGTGYVYSMNILDGKPGANLDASGTGEEGKDLFVVLASPGIAPPVVPLGIGDSAKILIPGASEPVFDTGVVINYPTYWRREDN